MKRIFTVCLAFVLSMLTQAGLFAQDQAVIRSFAFNETVYINKVSDNGLWGVASNVDENNSTLANYPYLLDITQGTSLSLLSDTEKASSPDCGAYDVTDDGRTVVGLYQGKPAVCTIGTDNTATWSFLPLPEGLEECGGYVSAITPDGSCMVGTLYDGKGSYAEEGGYQEYPVMWKNGAVMELPNMPLGKGGVQMNRALDISADGKVIVGGLMYIYPADLQHYVYYVPEQTYELIGTEEFGSTGSTINSAVLSTTGEWVCGVAYQVTPIEGSEFPDEKKIPYRYNTVSKEFTIYPESIHHGVGASAIFNNGLMALASPIDNPYRTLSFLIDGYDYNLDLILSEQYGLNFTSSTGLDNTGLLVSASADGRTLGCIAVNEGNYVVTLPESVEDAAKGVNLLARATVSPESGSAFSYFRSLTVTFDKVPTVVSGMQAALYKEGTEEPLRVSASIVPTNDTEGCTSFYVNFRNTQFEDGVKYTVKIPAGTFRLGTTDTYNRDIEVSYTGRSDKPVQVVGVNLEDGMEVASLSYSVPVIMQFDTQIALTEGATGTLYQEGVNTPISDLTLATSSNMLAAYPSTKRNLFKGVNYIVKVPAGAVTDIMGNCANEEISYTYTGAYVPEAPADTLLFADDFADPSTSYSNFMLYEGDHNTPNSVASGWMFDADNTPWYFIISESEDSYDYCAGSVSMYSPAGQSDDWMVIRQLYLPNAFCYLDFDVQSYLGSKKDSLKIYVYADDAVYSALNESVINDIKTHGVCIYDSLESCGSSEEGLSGDWSHRTLSLEQFAGKNVYIAFVNRNTDQSALFVDNIKVIYKSSCLLALSTKTTVVNQEETTVKGVVRITDETETYDAITLFYHNEDKSVCDTLREAGLSLKKGSLYEFEFGKKLPLIAGEENVLTIGVILGEDTKTTDFTIKNLAFETDKKVVIEEVTGTWCTNCPDGIVAMEHIEESLPGKIVPVCIHYNDIYAYDSYAGALNLTALPTARINRRDTIAAPIVINKDTYEYSFTSAAGNESWMDLVLNELETEADADITVTQAGFDWAANTLTITTEVTYALNKAGVAANIFYVLLEDGLTGVQTNGRANMTDPIYGDWGKNGIYGGQVNVPFSYHDVPRAILGATEDGSGNVNISGISGIIPATVKSGTPILSTFTVQNALTAINNPLNAKVVAMLLDANTGLVINANVATLTDLNPEHIGETGTSQATVRTDGASVKVTFVNAGAGTATLYTTDGRLLDTAEGDENVTLNAHGHKGLCIVRLVQGDCSTTVKAVLR